MDENRQKLIDSVKKKHIYYKQTFGTESGKLVLQDLEHDCFVNRSTIPDASSVDPYQIAFKEGQRSVVLKIKNLMSDKQLKQLGINDETKGK